LNNTPATSRGLGRHYLAITHLGKMPERQNHKINMLKMQLFLLT